MLTFAWPVIVGREIAFHPALLFDLGAINSWAMPPMSAPQVVGWTLQVVLTQLVGLIWLDWLAGRLVAAPGTVPRAAHALWIGVTVASLVAIYQGTIDLEFLNSYQWIVAERATGTMLNGNAYGVCAAIAGAFAFAVLRGQSSRHDQVLAFVVLIVNLAGMWMTGSRTAWLCGVVAVVALAVAGGISEKRLVTRAVLAGSLIVLVVIVLAASAIGPLRRLLELPDTPAAKIAELLNRYPYGPIALQMVREYPLTGVGVGAFAVIAPDYWHPADLGPLPFDNAQNWWRHQAAELGLLGAFPLLALSAAVAWRALRGRVRKERREIGTVSRGLLIALGFVSFVGVPTQDPVVLLWFFLLVAILLGALRQPDLGPLVRHSRVAWTVVGALVVVHMLMSLVLARGSLAVEARAIRWQREYVAGAYPPEAIPESGDFRWTRRNAHFIWPATNRRLLIRIWAHHPDINRRPVQVTLATRCGPLFDEALQTAEPVTVAVQVPKGQTMVDIFLHVSRTWRPASYGEADTRELGAGITASFVDPSALSRSDVRILPLQVCTV
jgi:O-antigen ligase